MSYNLLSDWFANTDPTPIIPFEEKDWPFKNVKPREVQLRALGKAGFKRSFAFFMRQRLGKTWTAYAEYTILRERGDVDIFFLICPNSLTDQWRKNIEEVDPYTPIHIYKSSNKKKTQKFLDYHATRKNKFLVFMINYESMDTFLDSRMWLKLDTFRTYICADESTKIKDNKAKMTKACIKMADLCGYKRVLTGKPTANSNADIWSQLKFIGATDRNFTKHKYTFVEWYGFKNSQVRKNLNTAILQREMDPYCYIAEDKYIQGFEKVYEPIRYIKMTAEQAKTYDEMKKQLITEIMSGVKITAPIALTKYLRLQQISSGIAGDEDGEQHNVIDPFDNPKIKEVENLINDEVDNKVIIVCRFRKSIDNLYEVLTKHGHNCVKIVGGMKTADIEEQKRLFNEYNQDPSTSVDVLIAQEAVLSYGHTLCGDDRKPCDSVIFYENTFSLIGRSQCESRPEKAERNKPISYYDFAASHMDKYMIEALQKKEDGSMALMGYARRYGIFGDGDTDAQLLLQSISERL